VGTDEETRGLTTHTARGSRVDETVGDATPELPQCE
jgi:hypothetical protein